MTVDEVSNMFPAWAVPHIGDVINPVTITDANVNLTDAFFATLDSVGGVALVNQTELLPMGLIELQHADLNWRLSWDWRSREWVWWPVIMLLFEKGCINAQMETPNLFQKLTLSGWQYTRWQFRLSVCRILWNLFMILLTGYLGVGKTFTGFGVIYNGIQFDKMYPVIVQHSQGGYWYCWPFI